MGDSKTIGNIEVAISHEDKIIRIDGEEITPHHAAELMKAMGDCLFAIKALTGTERKILKTVAESAQMKLMVE